MFSTVYINRFTYTCVYSAVLKWFRLTSHTSMFNYHFNHCFLQAMQIHSSGIFSPYLVLVQSWCPDTPHLAQMCFIHLPPSISTMNWGRCVLHRISCISRMHHVRKRSFFCNISSPTPAVTVSTVYATLVLAPYDFQVHHIYFYQEVVYNFTRVFTRELPGYSPGFIQPIRVRSCNRSHV